MNKSMLVRLFFIIIMFVSCNVVQMVTQATTEIPDNFSDGIGGGCDPATDPSCTNTTQAAPPEKYVVFSCGGVPNLCLFDTGNESVTTLGGATIGQQESAVIYNGSLHYTMDWALYSFDAVAGNSTQIETAVNEGDYNLVEANGSLYFSSYAGAIWELGKYDGSTVSYSTKGNSYYQGMLSLGVVKDGAGDKLFMCFAGGSNEIFEIDLANLNNTTMINPATESGSAVASIVCNGSSNLIINNSEVITFDGSTINHYFSLTNHLENHISGGFALSSFKSGEGIYFLTGGGPYTLNRYDLASRGASIALHVDASWGVKTVIEDGSKVHFIAENGADDELWFYDLTDGSTGMLTTFAGSFNIFNIAKGSKGIYLFTQNNGIQRYDINLGTTVQVDSINTQDISFEIIDK